jgi:hypothetical protein
MDQDAPKLVTKLQTDLIDIKDPLPPTEVADGPDAAEAAKKRSKNKKKKKKPAVPAFDLQASDFVPTASFKFDPVLEPAIPATLP